MSRLNFRLSEFFHPFSDAWKNSLTGLHRTGCEYFGIGVIAAHPSAQNAARVGHPSFMCDLESRIERVGHPSIRGIAMAPLPISELTVEFAAAIAFGLILDGVKIPVFARLGIS